MRYVLANSNDHDELAAMVQGLINTGWQPHGGVSAVAVAGELKLFQAMIKRPEEEVDLGLDDESVSFSI